MIRPNRISDTRSTGSSKRRDDLLRSDVISPPLPNARVS
jgi:hypothetical protein